MGEIRRQRIMRKILKDYLYACRKKKRSFELEEDLFFDLITKNCYYCGAKPMSRRKIGVEDQAHFWYNGIDRKDSKVGYTPENCVTCCKICNVAKNNMQILEFTSWVKRLHARLVKSENFSM